MTTSIPADDARNRLRSLIAREPSSSEVAHYRRRRADLALRLTYGARRRTARVILTRW